MPLNGQFVLFRSFNQRIAQELVIRLGGKDDLPVIAALDDVLRLARDDVAGESGRQDL